MTDDITMIRYRIARAHETLDDARFLSEHGRNFATMNRMYYACFYAVSALLTTQGLSSSTHQGVSVLFSQHFVKTGLVDRDFGKVYMRLYQARHESDYTDMHAPSSEVIAALMQQATRLIDAIDALIQQHLPPASS
jgi:uncharacterized protein (UPF0332 family)